MTVENVDAGSRTQNSSAARLRAARVYYPRMLVGTVHRLVVVAATVVTVFSGCDNCTLGSHCEGNVLVECEVSSDLATQQVKTPCAVDCVTVSNESFCSETTEPVSACADSVTACWGEGLTTCYRGFPQSTTPCLSGMQCGMTACGARCFSGNDPDARCAAEPDGFCDGDTLTACYCGHVDRQTPCGSGKCTTVPDGPFCAETGAIDSRCGDPTVGASSFCANNTAFTCRYGYVDGETGCGPGTCQQSVGSGAECFGSH